MDVLDGRGEFLRLAREPTGLDVDPPAAGLGMDTDDEGVVGGSAQARVVGEKGGGLVAGEDAGIVEPNAEVVGCA